MVRGRPEWRRPKVADREGVPNESEHPVLELKDPSERTTPGVVLGRFKAPDGDNVD